MSLIVRFVEPECMHGRTGRSDPLHEELREGAFINISHPDSGVV